MSRLPGRRLGEALVTALALTAACVPPAGLRPEAETDHTSIPIPDRYAAGRLALLSAINQDRDAAGLAPVRLDSLATIVAQAHAVAMATGGFFSHYGQFGEAPYERAARGGLTGHVRENVYRWQVRSLTPVGTVDPWPAFEVEDAHRRLMASPGHRETILEPHRTHVGLGIAADSASGAVYVVEEFVAQHAEIEPPWLAWPGSITPLRGRVPDPRLRPLLVRLLREPAEDDHGMGGPRPGPYADGRGEGRIVPPWAIAWRPGPRSFSLDLGPALREPGRWYGVLFVAPREAVEDALATGAVSTARGWPGAAFLVEVY